MKWGTYNEQAAERLNGLLAKVAGSKVLFVLMALASLILIVSASSKFD